MPPPGELCSRKEGRLEAEHTQREEKLSVSSALRAGNIKSHLNQWSSKKSGRFIIETVEWGIEIDVINKPINKRILQMAHQQRKVKSFQENFKIINNGSEQRMWQRKG